MNANHKILLQYSLLGALGGDFIFHPLFMLFSYLMSTADTESHIINTTGIINVLLRSFSVAMLPWSLSFALFNGVIGFYYGTIKAAKIAREELIRELQVALAEVKKLSGMLPICSSCKNIRNDEGYWQQIEEYIRDHSEADFTHGICEVCVKKLYPDFYKPFKERMESDKLSN